LLLMDHHENPDTGLILCGTILVDLLYQGIPFPPAKLTLKKLLWINPTTSFTPPEADHFEKQSDEKSYCKNI